MSTMGQRINYNIRNAWLTNLTNNVKRDFLWNN